MEPNDQYAEESIIRTILLQRVASWLIGKYVRQLAELQQELFNVTIQFAPYPDDNTLRQTIALQSLISATVGKIRQAFAALATEMESDLGELIDIQAEREQENFAAIFGIEAEKPNTSGAALALLITGSTIRSWMERQAGDLAFRVEAELRRGVREGERPTQLVDRLRGHTATDDIRIPVIDRNRRAIQQVTRTATEAAANLARQLMADEIRRMRERARPDEMQIPERTVIPTKSLRMGWQQISVLDSRTTEVCRAYANRIWDLNFKPIGHNLPFEGGPPRHIYCRSSIIPILLDDNPAKDLTLAKWLRSKADAELAALLGPRKLALWRSGVITEQELIRQEDRQLTFDQLRNKK